MSRNNEFDIGQGWCSLHVYAYAVSYTVVIRLGAQKICCFFSVCCLFRGVGSLLSCCVSVTRSVSRSTTQSTNQTSTWTMQSLLRQRIAALRGITTSTAAGKQLEKAEPSPSQSPSCCTSHTGNTNASLAESLPVCNGGITIATAVSSADFSRPPTVRELLEASLSLAPEADREAERAKLQGLNAWAGAGYPEEDIKESLWKPEEEGQSGPSGCRGVFGEVRLQKWITEVELREGWERQRQLEEERKARKRQGRKKWVRSLVSVLLRHGRTVSPSAESEHVSNGISGSCVSDKRVVKKGNKFFRARRRTANLFRELQRPVESVMAEQRFPIK